MGQGALTVLRRTFGRLRHRRLDEVTASTHRHLGAIDDCIGSLDVQSRALASRVEALEASSGAEPSSDFYSPRLWNDLQRAPLPPACMPAELLNGDVKLEQYDASAWFAILREYDVELLRQHLRDDPQPIPAPEDRERYFGEDHLAYWLTGLGDYLLLKRIADDLGRPLGDGQRLLDFGCASGRVLRHAVTQDPGVEACGVDLGRQNVEWARRHLRAPVLQGTTIPVLPFEDATFDVMYAGSVFTHIDDFEEAWLAELRRVLKPGGFALITFHPERIWADMQSNPEHVVRQTVTSSPTRLDPPGVAPVTAETFAGPMPGERLVFTNLAWPVNNTNVIHSHSWIRERWGRLWAVEKLIPACHGGHQDGAVLRKV